MIVALRLVKNIKKIYGHFQEAIIFDLQKESRNDDII